MKNIVTLFFLLLTVSSFNLNSLAQSAQNEIIAKINGEDISRKNFDRLLNSQKKKLVEQFINETLILQAAQAKNINITEGEITKKLNLIKEKQGGEEAFNRFLSENNATLEDARNEIKNQILIQSIRNQVDDIDDFIAIRKSKSDIIIYKDKIFPKISDEETNNILAKEIQKDEELVGAGLAPAQATGLLPAETVQKNKIFISDIKEDTIIEPVHVSGKPDKTLQELRRRIEQRRVVNK